MTESMSVLKKHSRDGSVNRGVRDIEKSRMNTHLQDLQKVLEGNEIPESYQELIKYWIEELKTDSICYDSVIDRNSKCKANPTP